MHFEAFQNVPMILCHVYIKLIFYRNRTTLAKLCARLKKQYIYNYIVHKTGITNQDRLDLTHTEAIA